MPLTDAKIRRGKSAGAKMNLFDGGGLFLFVTPAGGKLWRLKYRFDGKEKLLALGNSCKRNGQKTPSMQPPDTWVMTGPPKAV